MRDRGLVGRSRIGRWLARWKPDNSYLYVIGQVGVRDDHNILDVGCGAGRFLDRLARAGFGRLSGVDPFLAADSVTPEGVKLYKRRFVEMDGAFDVIVFNHSFEHLPDPRAGLQTAHRKLSPNGLCLIQMPTPSSQAWAEYGVDWAQWDAPRHLTLMSRRGLPVLARACGFRLRQILDIGLPWSLMASELYRRGIGLRDGALDKHFSRSEFAEFRRRMSAANASGQGDAVSYVLEKA